jgi:16S rRNA (cytosine1402-N4)-methyltransferase
MENKHDSVLLTEAIEGLAVESKDIVVDATIGGAGHFARLYGALGPEGVLIGIDADADAITRAQTFLKTQKSKGPQTHLVHDNFRNLEHILATLGTPKVSKVLFDLGWSSFHLSAGRGFSFKADEPLLMTYGEPEQGKTAADLINSATEQELADIFFTYGEERFARSIARAIVTTRKKEPILTTTQLSEVVLLGTPAWYHHRRLHPATKVFQALRIAVNDELGSLRQGLQSAMEHLSCGGRISVITFHSIEDRIVKGMFRDAAHEGKGMLVNRKPIVPSLSECTANPRARSAKLRIFEASTLVSPMDALHGYHKNSFSLI